MPQLTKKINLVINLNVKEILREANAYIRDNFTFSLCIFAVNMVYMLCFKALDGGISNPLSILGNKLLYFLVLFLSLLLQFTSLFRGKSVSRKFGAFRKSNGSIVFIGNNSGIFTDASVVLGF